MNPIRLASALLTVSIAAVAPAQDNILIVIADDLGVDHVGAYAEGASVAPTPNIDALASTGVLFRNAWANPTCSPTRACINTGRYGFRTGVGMPGSRLSTDETTLPELLDATGSGYAHAWIGKWHLGGNMSTHPTDSGWSHFAGITGGGVGNYFSWPRNVNGQTALSTTYATTQIVDDAITWIGAQATPWLCVVAFNAPHTPFHAPPAALHTQNLTGLNPAATPLPFYQAAIEALDAEMGRLLASPAVDTARTNVIFLGDNGTPRQVSVAPFSASHAKGTPYEGGTGVPLVVSGPAVAGSPREESALVSAVDLLATCADLAGVSSHSPLLKRDSASFAPLLASSSATADRELLYAESFGNGSDPLRSGFATARDRDFKLIRRYAPTGAVTEEFYDLVASPFETNDLLTATLTASQQAARNVLADHIDSIRDTTGRFDAFGSATCVGSNGVPQIAGSGVPTVGAPYDVVLTQGPSSQPVVLTLSCFADFLDGIPLPFELTLIGAGSGCLLFTAVELSVPTMTDATGNAQFTVPVPNLPLAVGATLYHTWLNIDPGVASPLPLTTSPGLAATFGS